MYFFRQGRFRPLELAVAEVAVAEVSEFMTSFTAVSGHRLHPRARVERWECRSWWSRPSWSKDAARVGSHATTGSHEGGWSRSFSVTWPKARRDLRHAREDLCTARVAPPKTSRTRSSRCARTSNATGMRPARPRSRLTSSNAAVKAPRCPRSGGSFPREASSPPNRTNVPKAAISASRPNSPTNAGNPTSPIGNSPTTPTSRSSTSWTTTPGCA